MMTKQTFLAAALLAVLPLTGFAAGKSAGATMQVSFTVIESCTVQAGNAQPQVRCQFDTPYVVQAVRAEQAAPAPQATQPQQTNATRQPTVIYF